MSDEYILDNGTLKNKLGITNQQALNKSERKITRNAELDMPSFSLDFEGLKQIHKHLFEDIYEWAGQIRTTTLQKDLDTSKFTPPYLIKVYAKEIFKNFKKNNGLIGFDKEIFSKELANLFGHINNLHPFREGNGRTQRIFITEVAKQAGYEIDFSEITKERMIQASIEFKDNNPKKMHELFIEVLDKQMIDNLRPFNQMMRSDKGWGLDGWNNMFVANAHFGNTYQGNFIGTDGKTFGLQLTKESDTLVIDSVIITSCEHMKYLNKQNFKKDDILTLTLPKLDKNVDYEEQFEKLKSKLTKDNIKKDYPAISDNNAKVIELFINTQLAKYHDKPNAQQAILEKIQSQLPDIASGKISLPDLPNQDKGKGR